MTRIPEVQWQLRGRGSVYIGGAGGIGVGGGRGGGGGIRGRRITAMVCLLFFNIMTILAKERNKDNTNDGEGGLSAEVCQMETFEASCASDEVLVIRTALLGRLRIGRCVTNEQYAIGCVLDVLPEMDRLCSGRQRCEVKVDNNAFKRATPCDTDLKNHLWTTFDCVKVTLPVEGCDVLRLPSGILSSHVTEMSGCGVTDSPWIIEVGRGQRINITLYDFGFGVSHPSKLPSSEEDRPGYAKSCRVYATIRDTGGTLGQSRTICGGIDRTMNVFVSSSQRIEVRILTTKAIAKPSAQQQTTHFLLQYSAIGCADPVLSKDMWMKPTSAGTLTIGCELVNLQWQLTCKGNQWEGSHGNCTGEKPSSDALGIPYAASTVVIVIIAVAVSSVILLIGVFIIKRKMQQEHQNRRLQTEVADHYADGDYSLGAVSADKLTRDTANTSATIADLPGNDYARMRLQRMTDYYAGPPPYGFEGQSYGSGYKYPIVEHVYESPDSLRQDDAPGSLGPVYTPQLHGQGEPSACSTVGEAEGFQPTQTHAVHLGTGQGSSYRAGPGAPSKAKNAGNYSL